MAGITTDNFIITNPGLAGVRLLFGTGSNQGKVQGIIASTTDCNQNNYAAEFESLEVFNIFSTAFPIASRQAKTNHFYFEIHPPVAFDTGSITTPTICKDTTFVPSTVVDFTNNVYNVTFNSDQELRSSQYQFVVDSNNSGSSPRPSNIKAILADTAVTASVQDSFYTDSGIINGRFDGTETTKAQYGISPALAGNSFQGILFPSDTEDVQIASSSKDSNLYKDFIFTLDKHFTYAANQPRSLVTISGSINTLTPNARYLHVNDDSFNVRAQILGTANTGYIHISGSALGTHHHALADQKGRLFSNFDSFTSGEPFLIKNGGSDWEFIQSNGTFATDFGTVSGSVTHPFTQIFIQTGSRKYPSYDKDKGPFVSYNNRNNTNTHRINNSTSVFGDSWQIYKLIGDSIFEADGNQIGLVTDKKLLVVDTGDILYIDSRGQAIWNIGNVNLI